MISVLILNVTMVLANLSVLAMTSTYLMKEMKKVK
jgi:hypothetical protein